MVWSYAIQSHINALSLFECAPVVYTDTQSRVLRLNSDISHLATDQIWKLENAEWDCKYFQGQISAKTSVLLAILQPAWSILPSKRSQGQVRRRAGNECPSTEHPASQT